jgi:hypothetical protein
MACREGLEAFLIGASRQTHPDESEHTEAQGLGVGVDGEASDRATCGQPADPVVGGRGGHAEQAADIGERTARVLRQEGYDLAVCVIHFRKVSGLTQ